MSTTGIAAKLKKLQNDYIKKSFKYGKETQESEIVDILSDYAWSAEDVISKGASISLDGSATGASQKTNVPFCYVAERKSAVNAGIANIFNLLNATGQTATKLLDLLNIQIDENSEFVKSFNDVSNEIKTFLEKSNGLNNFMSLMEENNLNRQRYFRTLPVSLYY